MAEDTPRKLLLPGSTASDLSSEVLEEREARVNLDTNRIHLGDGVTPGGVPFASGAEVDNLVGQAEASAEAAETYANFFRRAGLIYPTMPPYLDGSVLRFSGFYQKTTNGYADRAPPSGLWYEINVPTDVGIGTNFLYLDVATNTLALDPVYAPSADLGTDNKPVLGHFAGGSFTSYIPFADIVDNQFGGEHPGVAGLKGSQTFSRSASDLGDLLAVGLFQGWSASGGNPVVVGGLFLQQKAPFLFARVFVRALDGGAPEAPTLETFRESFFYDPSGGLEFQGTFTFEKQYSPTLRSYILTLDKRVANDRIGFRVSLAQTGGRTFMLAGVQVNASVNPRTAIPTLAPTGGGAAPSLADFLVPREIALFAGDGEVRLHPSQIFADRPSKNAPMSVITEGVSNTWPVVPAERHVPLQASSLSDGQVITLVRYFPNLSPTTRQFARLTVRKIPVNGLVGKTIGIAFIGDSKVDDVETASRVQAILESYGAVVSRTGTLTNYDAADQLRRHEGRSGARLSDYTGARTTFMAPTSPEAYLASANYPGRYSKNPFLFTSSAPGNHGGLIFDYVQYEGAFESELTPHGYVVLDLGTNDKLDFVSQKDLFDFTVAEYTTIVNSLLSAGKRVVIAPMGVGWEPYSNEVQCRSGYTIIKAVLHVANVVFNQPNRVRVSGAWCRMDPFGWGDMSPRWSDTSTGTFTGLLADPTHPKGSVRYDAAAAIAADLAYLALQP